MISALLDGKVSAGDIIDVTGLVLSFAQNMAGNAEYANSIQFEFEVDYYSNAIANDISYNKHLAQSAPLCRLTMSLLLKGLRSVLGWGW